MMRRGGRRVRRPNSVTSPRLNITSMMDILTVLLLFLLKSFVVDGEMLTPPPGVELPTSSVDEVPEIALVVAVSQETILVGSEPVATVDEALATDDLRIVGLDASLAAARKQMEAIATLKGDTAPFNGKVTIQGDRELEFRLLQKVMATCSAQGFDQLSLAVIRDS